MDPRLSDYHLLSSVVSRDPHVLNDLEQKNGDPEKNKIPQFFGIGLLGQIKIQETIVGGSDTEEDKGANYWVKSADNEEEDFLI